MIIRNAPDRLDTVERQNVVLRASGNEEKSRFRVKSVKSLGKTEGTVLDIGCSPCRPILTKDAPAPIDTPSPSWA